MRIALPSGSGATPIYDSLTKFFRLGDKEESDEEKRKALKEYFEDRMDKLKSEALDVKKVERIDCVGYNQQEEEDT